MSAGSHLDDEQMSALVDGAAEPADAEHVRSCPECSARAESWGVALRLMAVAPPDPPLEVREAAVDAALATSMRRPAPTSGIPPPSSPTVTPIDGSRHHFFRRHGAGVAKAAAALVIVGGLSTAVALGAGHGSSSKSSAVTGPSPTTAAGDARRAAPSGASTGSAAGSAAAAPTAGSASVTGPYLGRFANTTSLAPAVRMAMARAPSSNSGTSPNTEGGPVANATPAPLSCAADAARTTGARPPASFQATLDYQGAPAQVFVFVVGGHDVAVVERTAGCVPEAHFTL